MKKITLLLLLFSFFAGFAKNLQASDDPECLFPVNLGITLITQTSATFMWQSESSVTQWEILVVEMGTPAPTDATSGIAVEGVGTYTVTDLLPCHHYTFYVRSNCGSAFSIWTGPFHFSTGGTNLDGTFSENFETTPPDELPVCWSALLNGDTLSEFASIKTVGNNAYESANALQMLNHSSGDGANIILVSPNVPNLATGTHRLRFHARTGFNAGSLEVGTVDTATNDGVFTFLEGIDLTDDYAEYIIDYSAYEGTDSYIALRHNSPQYSSIFIDNIVWEASPLCADVSAIVVNDTATDSVTLSWTTNGDESAWDIVYGDSSITDPGTLEPISPAPTSNASAMVAGLAENTSYNFWVRSVCPGGINGYWIGPVTVTTSCPSVGIFENDFETTAVDTLPLCWSSILSGEGLSETSYVHAFDGFAHSGTTSIRLNNTDSATEANIILVSPKLNTLAAATHRLKLWASGNGGSTILEVGTLNNNSANAVFTPLETITLGEQFQSVLVDFSNYDGSDAYIGFRNASESDYTSIFIDDVVWEPIPQCEDVTGISLLDHTTSSATVIWTPGIATEWEVAYGLSAITDPELATWSGVLNEPSYSVEGLLAATSYNVWVRSVCGDDNGNWIGPVVLHTECNPVATFSENFDSSNTYLPVCWNAIVTGASAEGMVGIDPYSAVSGPNGVLLYGAYSGESARIILVSPPVSTLSAGNHVLKFMASGSHPIEIGTLDGNTEEAVFTVFSTVTPSDFSTQNFTVDFANYAGTDTYIGLRLKTDGQNAYAGLDDISWSENLSSGSFDRSRLGYYPNPVKDELNLVHTGNINGVTVFNMLGQKMMESKAIGTAVKVDLSALSAGSYMVKVQADNQVQSIKIIKH